MNESDFVRVIASRPDDDTARLAYADWLEERGATGDAERAAFIRQREPPPMRGRSREVWRWQHYAAGLLTGIIPKTWRAWAINYPDPTRTDRRRATGSFPAAIGGTHFQCSRPPFVVVLRHGFVSCVATDSERFFKVAPRLFAGQPIEEVVLLDKWPEELRERRLWGLSPTSGRRRADWSVWRLPPCLFDGLPGEPEVNRGGWPEVPFKSYRDAGAAYEALSVACIRYGRAHERPGR